MRSLEATDLNAKIGKNQLNKVLQSTGLRVSWEKFVNELSPANRNMITKKKTTV